MTARHPPRIRTSEAIRRLGVIGSIFGEHLARLQPNLASGADGRLTAEAEAAVADSIRSLRAELARKEPSTTE